MIFINNKYTRWYNSIISNAQARTTINSYTEKHHIIPKSLGGSNKKDNLVKLTAREHFICHWALTKMVGGQYKMKMLFALNCMRRMNNRQTRYLTRITSKAYEYLKIALSNFQSAGMIGLNNPMYGRSAVTDLNLKWYNNNITNIFVPAGTEPFGYISGRINQWNSIRKKKCRMVVSPNGKIFDSLREAATENCISIGALRERIRRNELSGKYRKNKSYWSYYTDITPI